MWPRFFQKTRPDLCYSFAGLNKILPDRCRRLGALSRVAPQQLHCRYELALRLSYSSHVYPNDVYAPKRRAVKLDGSIISAEIVGTGGLSMRYRRLNIPGRFAMSLAVAGLAAVSSEAAAQSPPASERPELLSRLLACRSVEASEGRLICYDAATRALDSAEREGRVVVVDRAQVSATRRQLFGFELPSIALFDAGQAAERIDSVESTLTRASLGGDGKWVFVLADGGVWRQIDSQRVTFHNTSGQPVRIRRAALGSYLLTIGNSRAARVRRQ